MSRITVENIRKTTYDQNPQVKQYYIGRGSALPYEGLGLGNPFRRAWKRQLYQSVC